jgi:MarR family transcriptional regulator, organic hydroperoxide resistance regulator
VLVFISDRGLKTVARLRQRVDAHHDNLEGALGPRKTAQLKKLLENFIAESAQ